MSDAVRWLRLPSVFDLARLRTDLDTARAWHWSTHYNDQAHRGDWTSIALRSASGRADDIGAHAAAAFADTALLAQCPYFGHVIDSLACEKKSVRLMALDAGAAIAPHRDHDGALEDGLARLHVPIVTHPQVLFTLDGEAVHFSAGATWYMNANCLHAVRNDGPCTRVHLVLDCVANPWLLALFERSGWRRATAPKYVDSNITDANVGTIVDALRAQGSPAAAAQADRLDALR